ncbi:MAG TPA: isopeptide-forming domain-containing fimbrial protein, partial [Pyrinomonadaceae bacterium]|nr:isopeptide-forming domain-containing fimbrial protein [Pyrinomonadaceae bacterium]
MRSGAPVTKPEMVVEPASRFWPIKQVKFSRAKIKLIAAISALVFGVASSSWARVIDGSTPGGSVITNQAHATYSDDTGETFTTVSETVTVTIIAVASITVTPDDTTPSDTVGPREQVTRAFRVCNTGNTTDQVTLTQSSITPPAVITALYFDNDGSGTVITGDDPITLNQTVSPQLAPNACVSVLAVIDTNDVAAQSTLSISITARSTASGAVNGRNEDAGTIINAVGSGARLTDPVNASLAPNKLVNGGTQAVVSLGNQFTYTIAFRNSGDTAARNVVLADQLPATIQYVPSSLRLNDNLLSDAIDADEGSVVNNTIQVRLPRVDPAQAFRVTFSARLTNAATSGVGVVNNAHFTADNAAAVQTTDAVVVADPLGLVFAARGGSSAPIAGARVELFTNADGANLVTLPSNSGFVPNAANTNPFATDAAGHFSFKLSSESIVAETNYFMKISASGFLTRMIQLTLRPTHNGLFALSQHAVDGQELADAAFVLVRNDIRVEDLAALVMNIPMFEARGLQVIKSADRARVEIGDIVSYRVEVHNPTASTLANVTVEDRLPESFHYAEGSALLSIGTTPAQSIEPQVNGSTLLFTAGDLPAGSTAKLIYRVRIGANAGEGDRENVAVASGSFPSGERTTSSQARATVFVTAGVFSARQVLLGRVFVDTNQNGQFDDGDRPSPGVRLYLNNGQSVITDSEGLYNFPALNDGSIVISLDPVSLPSHYALSDGGRYSGKSWTRLLRTPVGGGGLLRQNFALIETGTPVLSTATPTAAPVSVPRAATGSDTQPAKSINGASDKSEPTTAGTYEFASTEDLAPVPAGTVRVVSPKPNTVIMTPALEVEAEVEIDSTVKVELNGEEVSDKNIGKTRLDHKNKIAGFTFVGLNLRPGPNKLQVTPIASNGSAGQPQEIIVMGRGPARRLEITTEKTEIQTGGSDSTIVRVSAFDQWGNPA